MPGVGILFRFFRPGGRSCALKSCPGVGILTGKISGHPFRSHWESFRENLLIKSRNQNIFEKFKLNRNLQTIPFRMMYNMSVLRHRFSDERWGEGGGALNHLPLLFCKSVYKFRMCLANYRIWLVFDHNNIGHDQQNSSAPEKIY